ncbi:uncharacterized protein BDZ99DRAFT_504570 [Mytilinidion resinicola]|uniref:Uncharacterized protein n=1 Tax=Mytilinidion resinicola TaxID=574789 RepID=A0A6A6XY62_9PEZI|nr:uncharacterized protein BDZ99DRAFT_504570 [Mytilinidion resinicola]KAF2801432.1 hypothetical protein BDZ99DRAFT_504570 [Mytilinidion resinicola]
MVHNAAAGMSGLPPGAVQQRIEEWATPTKSPHERLALLSEMAKKEIRRAQIDYPGMPALEQAFVKVLEETLFYSTPDSMESLRKVAESQFAADIETLSFCGLQFTTNTAAQKKHFYVGSQKLAWKDVVQHGQEQSQFRKSGKYLKQLTSLLARFPRLRNISYYPIPQGQDLGHWTDRTVWSNLSDWKHGTKSKVKSWERVDEHLYSSDFSAPDLKELFAALSASNVTLETFATPFAGNVAYWHSISAHNLLSIDASHRASVLKDLKHFSCNIQQFVEGGAVVQDLLRSSPNLETLDLSLFADHVPEQRYIEDEEFINPFMKNPLGLGTVPLPKLRDLRLTFDLGLYTRVEDILRVFTEEENGLRGIRKLGLAYVTLSKGKILDLETLWIISPREGSNAGRSIQGSTIPKEVLKSAAKTVKVHHDFKPFEHNWIRKGEHALYQSFTIFE